MIKNILKILCLLTVVLFFAGISAYFALTLLIKSEGTVIVPDLIGKDVVDVLKILTDVDLNAKVKATEFSERIPKGLIIFQSPEPGSEIKKGRDVKLIISKGARFIQMPDLRALTLRQALIALEEKGLCQGQLARAHSQDIEKDRVMAQFPLANDRIERTRCADILVSLGERQQAYKMPKLMGLDLEKAIALINQSRLTLGAVTASPQAYRPPNAVVEQQPPFGMRVLQGAVVNMAVNRPSAPGGRHPLRPAAGAHLFRYRVNCGYLKKRIRIQLRHKDQISSFFDDLVAPCEDIIMFIPGHKQTTLYLYEDDQLRIIQHFDASG
jgi:serine/threonine-protein kinase